MMYLFGILVITAFVTSLVLLAVTFLLMTLDMLTESLSVMIYTDPGLHGGWHCVSCDHWWLRGMFKVLRMYFRKWASHGAFQFAWEVQ